MGREQRPGDWAAWMGTPAPVTRAPAPVAERELEVAERESEAASAPASSSAPAGSPGGSPAGVPEPPASAKAQPGPDIPPHASPAQAQPDQEPDQDGEPSGGEHGRSARREATRQRILDAARGVFAERGVIGGTVEDICDRAGFTRGAFYSNFSDKDDVLAALVEREHARLLVHLNASFALVDRELAEAPDLASALGSIVDEILRSIPVDRQLSLVQTELEIHAIRRPELSRPFLEANNRFRDRIGGFIDAAMRRYGRELTVSPTDITDTVVAVAERSVRRALLAGDGADADAMASAVLPGILLALSRPVEA